jgi:hypothetical protein
MANKTKEECDQIIESGVVHFTIGEDFGKLIARIAQEHLEYGNDPVKALKTITESLMGCPTDLAVKILKGDVVLVVDVDTQEVLPVDRIIGIHDDYPKIDVMYYMQRMRKEIVGGGISLRAGLRLLQTNMQRSYGKFDISLDYDSIFKFVAGNNEALLEELRDDREIHGIENLILTTKDYIAQTMKVQNTMNWMMKNWDDFSQTTDKNGNKNFMEYREIKGECSDMMLGIIQLFQETLANDITKFEEIENDNVEKYIESAIAIDEVMKKGIEPVDIMDNYSAGWLSPDGVYYGLNGEIANMLHIQIADALQEIGIVPKKPDDEIGAELNPFEWLENHGWVKIHGNNIQFDGCNNFQRGKKNIDLTDKQIEVIRDYITDCHQCEIKVGWKMERQSIGMFTSQAMNNLPALYKKYFEY